MTTGSRSDVLTLVNLGIARQGFEQILNIVASATATCITSDSATQLGAVPAQHIPTHTCTLGWSCARIWCGSFSKHAS